MSIAIVERPVLVEFRDEPKIAIRVTPMGDVSRASVQRALGCSYASMFKLEAEGRLTPRKRLTRFFYPVEQVKALLNME